jgi:hypothetical protein
MVIVLVVINGYCISGYYYLLIIILLMVIGGYSLGDYSISGY